jgi:wyosine [tRNA(Phe)-imidazoG37] synthetase (radical SAM superfamily)
MAEPSATGQFRHVFGPVPSRRLGRSLGIDLVPFKTCTYDCVYCQLGRTTNKTVSRLEYVPLGEVLQELAIALQIGPPPDYITLAGSGEPTLFGPLGELISGIKARTEVPVVVLTNGSHLWDPQVRKELAQADVLMPSLDAGSDDLYQRINRPHPQIVFEQMVEGLVASRREFRGAYWLEVMLLSGLTDQATSFRDLAAAVKRISPDRTYLNTAVRPPAESWAKPVSTEFLQAGARLLGPQCRVPPEHVSVPEVEGKEGAGERVAALLSRRPCRLEDLCAGLAMHRNEVLKYLGHLLRTGQVVKEALGGETYYSVVIR